MPIEILDTKMKFIISHWIEDQEQKMIFFSLFILS